MPRPKGTTKPDAKRGRMHIRCSEEERVAFEARAKQVGYSTPEWARTLLRRDAGMWTGQEDKMKHDSESIWNSTFGPYETRATVLAECETQGVTPQDYAMTCIVDARAQGFDCDTSEAFASLCKQLGVTEG